MAASMATAVTTTAAALSSLSLRPKLSFPTSSSSSSRSRPLFLFSTSSRRHFPITIASAASGDSSDDFSGDPFTEEQPLEASSAAPLPAFGSLPPMTEAEIAAAYEELYGPAYSGESVLGSDPNVMDAKRKASGGDVADDGAVRRRPADGFEERVVQVRRVTKVVKGGKNMSFRAVVVVGDKKGHVGVGVGKAKEVADAIIKSSVNARRNVVTVPITKYSTFPHRAEGDFGAARVMLRPASPGSGVIAGGAVRIVLELAGVNNALGKQLRSKNALNNARATVVAIQKMKQFKEVAQERGIPMEELWK